MHIIKPTTITCGGVKQYFICIKGFCLAFAILTTTSACSNASVPVTSQPAQTSSHVEALTEKPGLTPGIITVTGGNSQPDIAATGTYPFNPIAPVAIQPINQLAPGPQVEPTTIVKPPFDRFVDTIKNGKKEQIVGVYVDKVMALRVVQQPSNNPAYVSTLNGVATQFLMAFQVAGNVGLLAHNYLAGAFFFKLKPGDVVDIIHGDGGVEEFEINAIHRYQALSPKSPTSDFVDQDSGERISANTLFYRMYAGDYHLTLQTCIQEGIEDSWGRLFVLATPL